MSTSSSAGDAGRTRQRTHQLTGAAGVGPVQPRSTSMALRRRLGRIVAASVAVISTSAGLTVLGPVAAQADTAPAAGTPATVSADALPTWQVNGVVWSQVIVGNTVYVTGQFTRARPPGVGVGGTGEVAANNIFAYDIRTGNRVASFNHSLNGVGQYITKSPDGSRIYVGGDFTTVDGIARGHIAAFNTSDGSLVTSFAPTISSRVSGIAVSDTTVYAGGEFFRANNVSRNRLAAFSVSNGALLPWAPQTDNTVQTLTLAAGKVVVGGRFLNLAGAPASGMGAVDPVSGAAMDWPANQQIRNGGAKSSIVNLRTDGTNVYGSGWAFGTGNFEGTFSASAQTGQINWLTGCHGDAYDAVPVGDVVYNVSHAHDCQWIPGGFPETDPWEINMRHASAWTNYGVGTNRGPDSYGWNHNGVPAPQMLQWYPDLSQGSVTGQYQAAWTITANDQYVVLGGEFPRVNGAAQQGLTRFAVRSVAPNKIGPTLASDSARPSALAVGAGTLRVAWQAAEDRDNETLTYEVFRSGTAQPVYTTTAPSNFFRNPMLGFRDKGLTPGASYRYTVRVTDPLGNVLNLPQTPAVTVQAGAADAYAEGVVADGASTFWRLGESSGTTVYDWAGFNDATAGTGVTRGVPSAIAGSSNTGAHTDGTEAGVVVGPETAATPAFSAEAWFKTDSTRGGKIIGYGNAASGNSGSYDRHVYMGGDGRLTFGVYPNAVRTVRSQASYNDNQWHHVVASLDPDAGMALWVDGKKVGSDATVRSAQDYAGRWRVGGDNIGGWPDVSDFYFAGDIDDVAVYPTALTRTQVQRHYTDSGRTLATTPVPTDTYGSAVVADEPVLYWRLGDAAGSSTVADSSGNDVTGIPTDGGITFGQQGAVAGTSDTAASFDGARATLGSSTSFSNPRAYSEELWFNTTTTEGGKLIGFGDRQTGTSGNYDRHVYMEDNGQITFGTWTGQSNLAQSAPGYNDGRWHHLVATQGPEGMRLYLDGVEVGSNPQADAQGYDGYWRVGGDTPWNGRTFFRGALDEVAVYDSVLDSADVRRHFTAGGGQLPNQRPTAAFESQASGLKAAFDGSGSSDPDGTVESYAWSFGDGEQATGVKPEHTYGAAGSYEVTLTVTDNRGDTHAVTKQVQVENTAPVARAQAQVDRLKVTVDGRDSSDADGTIASYAWSWGDGTADGSGAQATHTYAQPGTYTVTLTVTDNASGTHQVTREVVATTNQAPTAQFTATTNDLAVKVDARASADADGSIASYAWSWGDDTAAGTGSTASHTYAAPGTYTVRLTVVDNEGSSTSLSREVTVTVPTTLAEDTFERTVSNGWGDALRGGTWTRTGTASRFSVADGRGVMLLNAPGVGPAMALGSVSSTSTDLRVSVGLDKAATGGGTYVYVRPRVTPAGNLYSADLRVTSTGQVTLQMVRRVNGTDTAVRSVSTGLTYAPGERLMVRVQAVGSGTTTLRAKVWKVGTTEPAAWLVDTTDTTAALQTAGGVGLAAYLSGSATNAPIQVSFDDLVVGAGQ